MITREYSPILAFNKKLLDKMSTYCSVDDLYIPCHAALKNKKVENRNLVKIHERKCV